ncbi:MAG: flagellar biosynthesis regulatory protein FlaF [Micavibrio aeruginosavorus]|uniref:Flagellar biosynthesis regulatory protein FlaF n=1 Tax=Micavibrio aeruginosavorus TaxID=349221 RepID=A0A2W5Q158_9BACT|nr:MAG: flagellar biosynthesis regulatory protein FlaF [Micavibrio aeruginosavorus]
MPSEKHNLPRNNPYASAAGAYGTNAQKHTEDPRELEARVLLKSAQMMLDLQNNWDGMNNEILVETLKYNRNVWLMFFDTAVESTDAERPPELRNNIYNLAKFVFKREVDVLAQPDKAKLDVLIKINRDIAAGLIAGTKNAPLPENANKDAGTKNPPSGGWDTSA